MKRIFVLLLLVFITFSTGFSQTQVGRVKTRGRMVNGKHIPGVGLAGAIISIKGITDIGVRNDNGSFSFPVNDKKFFVQTVSKKGYVLVDADAVPKTYFSSIDTLYFVMDTPEQRLKDEIASERKLQQTLYHELQKREEEIKKLKEENKITQEEYIKRFHELISNKDKNEQLIKEMAERYSSIDYDLLDDFNRKISAYIEAGELTKADSMINSKGDIHSRIENLNAHLKINSDERIELNRRNKNLEKSEILVQKKREDIASDCYEKFNIFKLRHQNDSAAYYIELRANLDTTNIEWQLDASAYMYEQNDFDKVEEFGKRVLSVKEDNFIEESVIADVFNNFGIIYQKTHCYEDSELMHKSALEIRRRLAKGNPQLYESDLAVTFNNLGVLYEELYRHKDSELMYKSALEIRRILAKENPQLYESDLAGTLNNLARIYQILDRYEDSELMFKEALEIYRRLAKKNPRTHKSDLASVLNNLGRLYKKTHRYEDSEMVLNVALEIRRKLAKENPNAYIPTLVNPLINLGSLYKETHRYEDSELIYSELLEILYNLVENEPHVYESDFVHALYNYAELCMLGDSYSTAKNLLEKSLAISYCFTDELFQRSIPVVLIQLYLISTCYIFTHEYEKAEQNAREAIKIESAFFGIYQSLAPALLFQGKYVEAENIYQKYKVELKNEFISDFEEFEKAGVIPDEHKQEVERIKRILNE